MKYYRSLIYTAASICSMSALIVLSQVDKVELNKEFKIESLSGNVLTLDGIGLENIIKTSQNTYEKVMISSEEVTFKPTKYDLLNRVGEEVLENREVYRGKYGPAIFESDQYLISSQFDSRFPYATKVPALNIVIKEKSNGNIIKLEPVLSDISTNEWVNDEMIEEVDGTLYIGIVTNNWNTNKGKMLIYTLDLKTQKFEKHFEFDAGNINTAHMDSGKVLLSLYEDNDNQLVTIDLVSKEMNTYALKMESVYGLYVSGGQLVMETPDGLIKYDLNKQDFVTESPSRPTRLDDVKGYSYLNQLMVVENKAMALYYVNDGPENYQLLHVFDVNTGETLFEGKLAIRQDQGLVSDYKMVEL
ncbi:MAG: hypothetical protein ACRCST_04875 [Turicibacter sp.]